MLDLVNKVCANVLSQIEELEKKANHDVVYFKGAREAVAVVVAEVKKAAEESSGRQQQQSASQGGEGGKQSSLS